MHVYDPLAHRLVVRPTLLFPETDSRNSVNSTQPITLETPRFFYGWAIVPIAMLASICTLPGQSVCVGVFNESIRNDLNLSSAQFGLAYSLGTVLASLLLPLVGALMDRFGIRYAMIAVVLLLMEACFFIAMSDGLLWLLGAFFLLRLFGQGSLSLLANNSLAMWFHRHLGKVAGSCSVMVTFCFALSPLVVSLLISLTDWRTTYCILGVSVAAIMLPLLLFLFRNRPEDIGQEQDGITADVTPSPAVKTTLSIHLNLTMLQALSHRSYPILLLVMASWALIGTAFIFDVQAFAADRGAKLYKPEVASFILFMAAAAMQFVGGFLADILPLRRLISFAISGILVSILMLAFLRGDLFFVAYGLFGLSQGLLVSVSATIWVRYFGRTHLGKIKGGAMMAMVAGSSGGPLIMGYCFDLTGGYEIPLMVFTVLACVSFLASLLLISPQDSANLIGGQLVQD